MSPAQVDHPDHTQQHARRDQGARPHPGQQHDAGKIRADQDAANQRQEQQPRGERAVPLDQLHVVGQEQKDTEDRDPGQEDGDIRAAPGAVQDHPQRQQGMADPLLSQHKPGQYNHAGDQAADGQRGRPSGGLGVREAEDDEEEPDAGQNRPGPVHSRRVGRTGAADVHQRTGNGDDREHQVDVQGVAPREVLGEGPAENQAHRAPAGRY